MDRGRPACSEPGTREQVASAAAAWFTRWLGLETRPGWYRDP